MHLTLRFRFASESLRDRLRIALGAYGSKSSTARAIGSSPSRMVNIISGLVNTMPLADALAIESHLGVDLLGDDRAAIAAELRAMADRIDPPSPSDPPVGA